MPGARNLVRTREGHYSTQENFLWIRVSLTRIRAGYTVCGLSCRLWISGLIQRCSHRVDNKSFFTKSRGFPLGEWLKFQKKNCLNKYPPQGLFNFKRFVMNGQNNTYIFIRCKTWVKLAGVWGTHSCFLCFMRSLSSQGFPLREDGYKVSGKASILHQFFFTSSVSTGHLTIAGVFKLYTSV